MKSSVGSAFLALLLISSKAAAEAISDARTPVNFGLTR